MSLLYLSILLLIQSPVLQNETILKVVFRHSGSPDIQHYTIDGLGNVYMIKGQTLIKEDSRTGKKWEYTNKTAGIIHSVDISDPFRILLLYKDFNQAIFLNNYLAEISSPILLDDLGVKDVELICTSKAGGFWVFDNFTGQIFLFGKDMKPVCQSQSINSITDKNSKPVRMIENSTLVYLSIPNLGILVFNQYGTYHSTIPLLSINDFQIINQSIIYYNNHMLFDYNILDQTTRTTSIPDTGVVINCRLHIDHLYVFKHDGYTIYKKE